MQDVPGSQAFLKADIEGVLTSLLYSVMLTQSGSVVSLTEYQRGFAVAILATAKAFGINSLDTSVIDKFSR